MRKFLLAIGAALAWAVTIFTYKLPHLNLAHASEEEAFPFVVAFGVLALTLSVAAAKAFMDEPAEGPPPGPGPQG